MQKTRTTVKIAGKEYTISSYDDENYVKRVAAYVNRRMDELGAATRLPSSQLAVLTAMNVADDMLKARDELRQLRNELAAARDDIDSLRKELELK